MERYNKETTILGFANDHIGLELKAALIAEVQAQGWIIEDFGTYDDQRTDYPIHAQKLTDALNQGKIGAGIVICGTGLGIGMAAGKAKNIRCARCTEEYSARMSRQHNNANVLALGSRVTGLDLAKEILWAWLNTEYEGSRHERRVQQLNEM